MQRYEEVYVKEVFIWPNSTLCKASALVNCFLFVCLLACFCFVFFTYLLPGIRIKMSLLGNF